MASEKQSSDTGVSLILYGTSACHLCEIAEQMLQHRLGHLTQYTYQTSDISLSDDLFEQYGLRIPVLRRAGGAELDWPFSESQLDTFLLS